jgi:hypothetical protein
MRSFRVEAATDFRTTSFFWVDCHALTCRPCEQTNGEEGSMFVPDVPVKVGQTLHCPSCGEPSVIPKKARWQ